MGKHKRKRWPSVDDAKRWVSYNPETGDLRHIPRKVSDFEGGGRPAHVMHAAWSARWAGRKWGRTMKSGHISGTIRNIHVYAHQVAWAIMTGEWPKHHVNHINGDPADNRWVNLRAACQSEVTRNQSMHKDNRSGYSGVHQRNDTGKWVAKVGSRENFLYLGCFDTAEEAALAVEMARIGEYHENHGKRPSRFTEPQRTSQTTGQ